MTFLRFLLALGGLALLVAIVWAAATAGQSLSEAIAWLVSGPWGVVSLVDLYLGFAMFAVVIWLLEPSKPAALAFILPMPFLGNVWGVVWLIWRAPMLARLAAGR